MARYVRVSDESKGPDGRFVDLNPEEQKLLLEWIRKFFTPERQPVNSRFTSYGLKHLFGRSEFGFYVYCREFQEAMELAGFESKPTPWGDWWFNTSEADVRKADDAMRELDVVPFGVRNPKLPPPVTFSPKLTEALEDIGFRRLE